MCGAQVKKTGAMTANGEAVELPCVYTWPEKEGFYDSADPTWNILLLEREVAAHEIGNLLPEVGGGPGQASAETVSGTCVTDVSGQCTVSKRNRASSLPFHVVDPPGPGQPHHA